MDYRAVSELRPHPENVNIYGDSADGDLVISVKEKGVINPLLITWDNRVINGHRRLDAARRAGLKEVPFVEFPSRDELDILEALVESNRQRAKTNEQIGREARVLLSIEQERLAREKAQRISEIRSQSAEDISDGLDIGDNHSDLQAGENTLTEVSVPEQKPRRDSYVNVGDKVGRGSSFVHQTVRVVDAIDQLEERGRTLEAQQLRTTLNQSAKKAYDTAKKQGFIQVQEQVRPPKEDAVPAIAKQEFIILDEYLALEKASQEALFESENTGKKFNKQEQAHIEWAHWSWNPITGCKHNCPYCYARDIANRFYPTKFEPTLWTERLHAPMNTQVPPESAHDIGYKNVFTCSMADLFGRWVPTEWIEKVLQVVADNPQWNFLFLTKFPIRMAEFDYPDNAWMGTSVDCQIRVKPVEAAFSKVNAKVKWLSCEPMIEPLKFTNLDMFSWVVIGGASKSSQTPEWVPPRAWVHSLEMQAYEAGCMVYEKTNLQPVERLIEFPGQPARSERRPPEALRYLPEVESI